MNKFIRTLSLVLIMSILSTFAVVPQKVEAAGVDRNRLCEDDAFTNVGAINAQGIQDMLVDNGSFLRNYKEGGRTAAQIIYDAARGNGINPIAILAMIQKEEGLITGRYSKSLNQVRLDWAMGYGYTDSTIYNEFKGFTKQIDNGTWQLKRNFDYWSRNGSKWNVGKTMVIDGQSVRFSNRCTSAQYRYTPHLGINFANYFSSWNAKYGGGTTYDAKLLSQSRKTYSVIAGKKVYVYATYKNTGNATWYKTGPNATHFGNADPIDRRSVFENGENIRFELVQSSVRKGRTGTFKVTLTAPAVNGTYVETFRPVTEGITWMGDPATWTFKVIRGQESGQVLGAQANPSDAYQAKLVSQNARNYTFSQGKTVTFYASFKNTGSATWYKTGNNPTHLGNSDPNDRRSVFQNNENIRSELVQQSVAPGKVGTFKITLTAPRTSGSFVEKFRPVTEGVTWFGDEAYWNFRVR